jgi:hypothetical protein
VGEIHAQATIYPSDRIESVGKVADAAQHPLHAGDQCGG